MTDKLKEKTVFAHWSCVELSEPIPVPPKNHFPYKEISCPCCGLNNFSAELLMVLNRFRASLGRPVILNSACRCKRRDLQIYLDKLERRYKAGQMSPLEYHQFCHAEREKERTSSHIKGLATDIRCDGYQKSDGVYVSTSQDRWEVLRELFQYEAPEIRRLGIYPGWIHIDLDPDKPQGVVWLYK